MNNNSVDEKYGNNNGWIESNELYQYISEKLPKRAAMLNVIQEPELMCNKKSAIPIVRNIKRLISMDKDIQLNKVKSLFEKGLINADQLEKAVNEINSGQLSKYLKSYIDGKISSTTFISVY